MIPTFSFFTQSIDYFEHFWFFQWLSWFPFVAAYLRSFFGHFLLGWLLCCVSCIRCKSYPDWSHWLWCSNFKNVTQRFPVRTNNLAAECKSDPHEEIIYTLSSNCYSSHLKAFESSDFVELHIYGSWLTREHDDVAVRLYKYSIWQLAAMADTPQKAWLLWGTGHLLSPRPYLAESKLSGISSLWLSTIMCGLQPAPSHLSGLPTGPALFGIIACRLFISHS